MYLVTISTSSQPLTEEGIPHYSPEDQVTDLIGLPCMHESDVARDSGLHDKPPTAEEAGLLRVSWNHDAGLHSTGVVADRNTSGLYGSVRASGGEDAWFAGRVGMQTGNEGALGNEFDADLAVEVPRLEELVPAREEEARSGGKKQERARENHAPPEV